MPDFLDVSISALERELERLMALISDPNQKPPQWVLDDTSARLSKAKAMLAEIRIEHADGLSLSLALTIPQLEDLSMGIRRALMHAAGRG